MVVVLKFGGASVKDAAGVKNLAHILNNYPTESLLIVVSAMGKTTNLLESIADRHCSNGQSSDLMDQFRSYHLSICDSLFGAIPDSIKGLQEAFDQALKAPSVDLLQFKDRIVAFGELMSTKIVAEYLGAQWLDARAFIKTDSKYSEADVHWKETEDLIVERLSPYLTQGIVVTQGYIGSDQQGNTTTLGREGSDYSGAIFAHCLGADSLTVWKDVPGMMSADPRHFIDVEKFDEISYQEVIELTYYGAKVIHPKTIHPLSEKNIPLFVKSFVEPSASGTKISGDTDVSLKTSFVIKEDQLLISVRVIDNSFMDEDKMSQILESLSRHNIKANLIHNSALTFTCCIDNIVYKKEQIIQHLSQSFQVLYNENLFLATIKNYREDSFEKLPKGIKKIIEQQSRNNYQVVYQIS